MKEGSRKGEEEWEGGKETERKGEVSEGTPSSSLL